MTRIGEIYRGEILRAVFGKAASELKVADLARLNQLCERLAECEEAQTALRARGYGRAGMTFIEIVREVPERSFKAPAPRGILQQIFRPAPSRTDGLRYSPEEIAAFFRIPLDDAETSDPQAAATGRR